ncbi:MAG: tetratricopeptide repeat protein [Flavobacteriales bacterium]|nr:tetratricopeptide repeat protein [Flavobacteriales bacterium]
MKRSTLFLIMTGLCLEVFAQPNLDSLYAVWQDPQRPDTVRTDAFKNYIARGYINSKPDSAFLLAEALIDFAEAHDLLKEKGIGYGLQASALSNQGSYARAITILEKCIVIFEETRYQKGMTAALNNIGRIHFQQGNFPKALAYYQRGLSLSEAQGNKDGMAVALNAIGSIHLQQGDHAKALDHFQRSVAMSNGSGYKFAAASALANIGAVYALQKEHAKALDYLQQAVALSEELGSRNNMALPLATMSSIYSELGDYPKAFEYCERGLAIFTELGDKDGIAASLHNRGTFHALLGEHQKAVEYCSRALAIAQETGALARQKDACNCLYYTYKAMGKGMRHYPTWNGRAPSTIPYKLPRRPRNWSRWSSRSRCSRTA